MVGYVRKPTIWLDRHNTDILMTTIGQPSIIHCYRTRIGNQRVKGTKPQNYHADWNAMQPPTPFVYSVNKSRFSRWEIADGHATKLVIDVILVVACCQKSLNKICSCHATRPMEGRGLEQLNRHECKQQQENTATGLNHAHLCTVARRLHFSRVLVSNTNIWQTYLVIWRRKLIPILSVDAATSILTAVKPVLTSLFTSRCCSHDPGSG